MADFSLLGGGGKVESFFEDLTASRGTQVTAGATPHVKTAWTEVIASTSFDYESLLIELRSFTGGHLLDMGIGSSGNEEVIIPNLLFALAGGGTTTSPVNVNIPIHIPAGSRISLRHQSTTNAGSFRALFKGFSGNFTANLGVNKIVAYGANTADSGGVVVDPGTTVDTKGSYSEIVASTGEDIRGFHIAFGDRHSTRAVSGFLFDIAIGASSSEEIILPNYYFSTNTSETAAEWMSPFIPVHIPSGTRIAVRAQAETSSASQRLHDVVIYGAV